MKLRKGNKLAKDQVNSKSDLNEISKWNLIKIGPEKAKEFDQRKRLQADRHDRNTEVTQEPG